LYITVRCRYKRQLIQLKMSTKWPTWSGMEDSRPIFSCKRFSYNENALNTVVYKVLQASISCTNGDFLCTILVWALHRVSVCARIMYQTWQESCKIRARCGAECLHLAAQPSFQCYKREAGPETGRRVAKIRVIGATSAHTDNATASFHSPTRHELSRSTGH